MAAGRKDQGDDAISSVGIIGKGKMGAAIVSYLFDFADLSLVWLCKTPQERGDLARVVEKKARKMRYAGVSEEQVLKRLEVVTIADAIDALSSCDLVIESITENAAMKAAVVSALNAIADHRRIIASNTSSLPLDKIFEGYKFRHNTLGLHFFYPVALKNIVEINRHEETGDDAIRRVQRLCGAINRDCLVLDPANNFVLNRMFSPIMAVSFFMLQRYGLSAEAFDEIVRGRLIAHGVFETIDTVGLDIILTSARRYFAGQNVDSCVAYWIQDMEDMVREGSGERATPSGFRERYRSGRTPTGAERQEILEALTLVLINVFFVEIAKGYCPAEILRTAFSEYLGVDFKPYDTVTEMGCGNTRESAYEMLRRYHDEYRNEFFVPHASLRTTGLLHS